ncbi:hypothetical protein BDW75DRAFT_188388 [Aspergillus navahoensis]
MACVRWYAFSLARVFSSDLPVRLLRLISTIFHVLRNSVIAPVFLDFLFLLFIAVHRTQLREVPMVSQLAYPSILRFLNRLDSG